ncbi:multidrug transporter [Collibacillus ludicampi]|uniref:Multidrug transporter n=1 Tax=Collibacillus ludicampi TaxID=2771369 RepID=A0AAV4LBR1_9BACL|nr:DMT family transporter [Collibacillus ludicampi]GIM45292.1 multidrug transporter [Collibacillus ludicampi]
MEKAKCPVPTIFPLMIGVVSISFSSIFIKWSHAPASILGMYRLLFTVLLMAPFLRKRVQEIQSISRRDWKLLILSGIFLGLHFLFWIGSLKYTTVASSMILTALEPFFVMIGAYLVFKEKTNGTAIICMAFAITGTVFVSGGDIGNSNATAMFGDMLSILGTMAVSVHMLVGQTLSTRMSSFVYSILVFLIATGVFVIYNLIAGVPMIGYPASEWGIFILLAVVPTVFGHVLFNWLLKYVNATTISMSILGEPVGSIILAFFLLGESITDFQIVGGILSISGVLMFLKSNKGTYSHDEHAMES